MSDREPSLDRRALLAATGATAAGSIAGCADIIESAVEGLAESTKSFDATPAGVSKRGARRLGLPATNTTEYRTRRTPTIGGDRYLLFETHQLTSYYADIRLYYRMGVLSTPVARVDGTPSNPLATDGLGSFLTGEHGERFLKALGAPSGSLPGVSRIGRTPGTSMFGASTTVEVYATQLPSGDRGRREPWYIALARALTGDDAVILGCIVDADRGLPDADTESRARDLVYDAAPTVTADPSWSGSQVPDVTVEDVRLVQTVEESTVQGGTDIPDPDLVEGEPTVAMFTLQSPSSSPTLPAYLGTTVRLHDFRVQYDEASFDLREGDAAAILGSGDAPAVFHEATRADTWGYGSGSGTYPLRMPVFTVRDDTRKVSVDVATPVGVHVDTAETTDVSIPEMAPLRVGFIELRDPGATKNTDIDFGDANGRAKNYDLSVRSSFRYLQHAFPGQVVAYRHDSPMVGNIKENFESGTDEDAREARTTLNTIRQQSSFPSNGTILTEDVSRQEARDLMDADTGGAFDVTVMILPRGNPQGHQDYFAAHGMGRFSGYYWGNKKAVGSLELSQGGSNMGHVSTTAQEIGHYFGKSLYSGARARTKPNGNTDRMHASGNVRTVGYDLTDGTFRLVTDPGVPNGTFGVDPPATDSNGNPVTTSYASFMSYAGGDKWTDGLIHSELMAGRHTVSPDLAGAAGTNPGAAGSVPSAVADADADLQEAAASVQPVIEAFGVPGTDGIDFGASVVYDAVPVDADGGTYDPDRHEDARPVEVALRDPAGETLVTATVPDRVHGSHGDLAFESVALSLPFPRTAVSLVAIREDVETRLNPIVHPLRVAVAAIPPRGTDNVDANRVALEEALDDADTRMSDGEYGEAASVLDESFRQAVEDGVVGYDAFANQPTGERLLALTDRMVERLVGLAETDAGPSGTVAVHLPDGTRRCVEPVEGEGPVQEYYGYGRGPSDSSSTPDGLERDDATVTFVYRNAETGALSLVCLNGNASGTTDGGGRAPMTFRGVTGYEWQVQDGRPGSGAGDFDPYETEEGSLGESESVIWGWDDTKTDGGAIGPLGETFAVDVVHRAEATVRDQTGAREGLDSWLFVDGSALDTPIELASFTGETGEVTVTVSDEGCR